jgi:Uma2 family endonuclease
VSLDAPALAPPIPGPVRRFSVAEYHRLVDAGLFGGEERVELLEGWIVAKMTRKPPHDAVLAQLAELLRAAIPATHHLRIQSAVTTGDSEPEPDIAVVRGRALDYREAHPRPADIALLVEVADSSLERDRVKARIYARAGVCAYWIVNLVDGWVEVYADPSGEAPGPTYHRRQDYASDREVPVLVAGAQVGAIAVRDMIPA